MSKLGWLVIFVVVLPLAYLKFRDGPAPRTEPTEASAEGEGDEPMNLAKEYVELLEQTKEGLSNLKDTKPVKKVIEEAKELGPVIGDVLRRAFSAPPSPDDEGDEEGEADNGEE